MYDATGKLPDGIITDGNWKILGSFSSCVETSVESSFNEMEEFVGRYCSMRFSFAELQNDTTASLDRGIPIFGNGPSGSFRDPGVNSIKLNIRN